MTKRRNNIFLFKKLVSIASLSLFVLSYQNCAQSGSWSADGSSGSSDQASSGGSQSNTATNYPAKSVEELQATCDAEKENVDIGSIRPLTAGEYINTIRMLTANLLASRIDPILSTIPGESSGDSISSYMRFVNARAFFSDDRISSYHRVALAIADTVENTTHAAADINIVKSLFHGCYISPASTAETCIDTMVKNLGRRAFRRPLTTEHFDKIKTLMGSGSAETRLARAAYYILMSPNFLIQLQNQGTLVDGVLTMDQYSLASKIAFFLTGTGPSDTLLNLASSNKLSTAAEIKAAVEPMLNSEYYKIHSQMGSFLSQWLGLQGGFFSQSAKMKAQAKPTYTNIPIYDLYYNVNAEVLDMFEYYLIEKGTYKDVFTTDKSFTTNAELAKIYGTPVWSKSLPWTAPGSKVAPATHKARQRAGFLTTVTMLTTRGDITNPFAVGGNIYKHVLCRQFGDAPLPQFQPALDPGDESALLTTRERFEKLVPRGSSCMKCHSQTEGLGMPMQDYDTFGRHREGFEKVFDNSGVLIGSTPVDTYANVEIGGKNAQVRSGVDLIEQLASTSEPQACFARQLVRFANARSDSRKDSCQVLRLAKNLQSQSMWEAIKSFVADPAFAKRRLN